MTSTAASPSSRARSGNLGPGVERARCARRGRRSSGSICRRRDGVEAADVTDRDALRAALERITAAHGAPAVLVNNAGIDQPPDPDAAARRRFEAFSRTLEVNLAGTFNATQVFGAAMVEAGRGSIVNIGSLYASIAPEPRFYDHTARRSSSPPPTAPRRPAWCSSRATSRASGARTACA